MLSPGNSIKKHCRSCSENPREVKNCELTNCILFKLRLGKKRNIPGSALKAIRLECLSCCLESYLEVENCLETSCFLYPYRLGKTGRRRVISADHIKRLQEGRIKSQIST